MPIITTQPLRENSELEALLLRVDSEHPSSVDSSTSNNKFCSNLKSIHRSDSLLTRFSQIFDNEGYPLYSHLNYLNCEWKFSKWYPLSQLVDECGVDLLSTNIRVKVHAMYVQLTMEQNIQVVFEHPTTTSLQRNPSPSRLIPSPIHFFAFNDTHGGESYIYPIAVQYNTNVYFYSVGDFDSDWLRPTIGTYSSPLLSESQPLTLLHTDNVRKRQAWLMEVEERHSVFKYDVTLQTCGGCGNKKYTTFHLELQIVDCDSCYVPVLDVLASVKLQDGNDKNMTNSPPEFTIGKRRLFLYKLQECPLLIQ